MSKLLMLAICTYNLCFLSLNPSSVRRGTEVLRLAAQPGAPKPVQLNLTVPIVPGTLVSIGWSPNEQYVSITWTTPSGSPAEEGDRQMHIVVFDVKAGSERARISVLQKMGSLASHQFSPDSATMLTVNTDNLVACALDLSSKCKVIGSGVENGVFYVGPKNEIAYSSTQAGPLLLNISDLTKVTSQPHKEGQRPDIEDLAIAGTQETTDFFGLPASTTDATPIHQFLNQWRSPSGAVQVFTQQDQNSQIILYALQN